MPRKPDPPPEPLLLSPAAVVALHQMGEAFYALARSIGYSPPVAQELLEAAAGVAMHRAWKVHAGIEEPSPDPREIAVTVREVVDKATRAARKGRLYG